MILRKIIMIGCASFITSVTVAQRQRVMTKEDSLVRDYQKLSSTPEGMTTVKQKIDQLANTREEKDISLAVRLAGVIKQSAQADSLNKVEVKRYPTGPAARNAGYANIVNTHGTGAQKAALYGAWIKNFPEPVNNTDIVYDYARTEVAGAYAEDRDAKNNRIWIDKIKSASFKGTVQNADGKIFLMKGDTAAAESLIHSGLMNAKANLEKSENPGAKADYRQYLISYASLLYDEKKYPESLQYITEANNENTVKEAPMTELHALILTANGRGKEALPTLTNLVKNGRNTSNDLKALKLAYVQDKGSDAGYSEFFDELMNVMKENVRAKLAKSMLSEPAQPFRLVDLDGKTVSLDDCKGKVVILDFWATWCGPCKRSFPAMQMAQNKYKNDPNVKFFFIDTWERIPDPKKDVKAYITENKYSFRVLLDDKNTKVVDKYGITGIPAKFVISGDGKIRYKLTGFDGSNEAAVEELSTMIDAAKKAI